MSDAAPPVQARGDLPPPPRLALRHYAFPETVPTLTGVLWSRRGLAAMAEPCSLARDPAANFGIRPFLAGTASRCGRRSRPPRREDRRRPAHRLDDSKNNVTARHLMTTLLRTTTFVCSAASDNQKDPEGLQVVAPG